MSTTIEASAPCALRLAPGVGLALDRRVSCSLELRGAAGAEIEVKEGLLRVRAERVADLPRAGLTGWLAGLMDAAGIGAPVKLSVQARLPESSGLGVRAALAACTAQTLLVATGRASHGFAVAEFLRASLLGSEHGDAWTSLLGGLTAVSANGAGERLPVDPACVEERLLLVDPGATGEALASFDWSPCPDAGALVAALRERRYADVGALLDRSDDARRSDTRLAELVEQAQRAGAASWRCRLGTHGLLALWAEPARRAALQELARRAGLRPVSCRLDLLGLECERLEKGVARG